MAVSEIHWGKSYELPSRGLLTSVHFIEPSQWKSIYETEFINASSALDGAIMLNKKHQSIAP